MIYADLLFAIDLSMDFLALFLTARLLHLRPPLPYLLLAAAIGAGYSVADTVLGGNRLFSLLIAAGTAVLMCYVVFGGGITLLRSSLLFLTVDLLLGGGMTALYSLLNRIRGGRTFRLDGITQTVYDGITLPQILIFAAAGMLICLAAGRFFVFTSHIKTARVTVSEGEITLELEALVDSGNVLTEPLTGKPVILLPRREFGKILPSSLRRVWESGGLSALSSLPSESSRHFALIPARSALGKEEVLLGFLPRSVTVGGKIRDAYVAAPESGNDCDFGGCGALLPDILAV